MSDTRTIPVDDTAPLAPRVTPDVRSLLASQREALTEMQALSGRVQRELPPVVYNRLQELWLQATSANYAVTTLLTGEVAEGTLAEGTPR